MKNREENEGWRQELERALEQEMQQLTYQTEQERENNNENQHLEENRLINQNKHQSIRITI